MPVVLDTPRLRLRPHVAADFAAIAALWADADVVRFITGRPATPTESWARLLRHIGHWSAIGYGYWVVETREDGRFLGEVGFGDFRRALDPPVDGIPEAGWVLRPAAAGRGHATEAMRAALDWLDRATPFRRSFCIVDPRNRASSKVAEKLGYGNPIDGTCNGESASFMFRNRPNECGKPDPELSDDVRTEARPLSGPSVAGPRGFDPEGRLQEITVRRADKSHFAAFQSIELAAFETLRAAGAVSGPPQASSHADLQGFADAGLLFGAFDEAGQAVGFAGGVNCSGWLHVAEIDVHPDWQGRGVGRRLLDALLDCGRARALLGATLTTDRLASFNARFYTARGFQTVEDNRPEFLRHILEEEVGRGLDPRRRVAMRIAF